MNSMSGFVVSTTHRGREYAGSSSNLSFSRHDLVRLLQRAVELEESILDAASSDSSVPLPKKRAPSPSPLEPHSHQGPNNPLPRDGQRNQHHFETHQSLTPLAARKKNGSHLRRKKKKLLEIDEKRRQTVALCQPPIISKLLYKSDHIEAQSTGYCGLTGEEHYPQMDLDGYRKAGYVIQSWDGIRPLPVTDDCGTIYAVFAGRPVTEDYLAGCQSVFQALEDMPNQTRFLPKQRNHRRGKYPSADFGITADQGQQEPVNIYVPRNISERAMFITNSLEMERIVNFCDTSFQKWAPRLHAYYRETMNKLINHPKYHYLKKPGSHAVFSSMSHNYGRSVVTAPHRDYKNLAFGWCAIVSLGDFDSQCGGHLVLHEPRLVVEFPPGSAALIPSAVLTHSNVAIGPSDKRASVTFYSSGSVFRFIENDFQTLTSLKSQDIEKYERRQGEMKGNTGKGRWEMGLELYSTLQQLKSDVFE